MLDVLNVKKVRKADRLFYENMFSILEEGYEQNTRAVWDDGTVSKTKKKTQVFETYNLRKGELPITSLRPIVFEKAIGEILWIYRDSSNDLNLLLDKYKVSWWDKWDVGNRKIGAAYGEVVRRYNLLNRLIEGLKRDPFGRRHIMSLWQEKEMAELHGLDPCCYETLWNVTRENGDLVLNMHLNQRSCDYIVAGHINKVQYCALLILVAREVNMVPGNFSHFVMDLHIYDRHEDQAREMLRRFKDLTKDQCNKIFLELDPDVSLDKVMPEDFKVVGYNPLPKLQKLEVAK